MCRTSPNDHSLSLGLWLTVSGFFSKAGKVYRNVSNYPFITNMSKLIQYAWMVSKYIEHHWTVVVHQVRFKSLLFSASFSTGGFSLFGLPCNLLTSRPALLFRMVALRGAEVKRASSPKYSPALSRMVPKHPKHQWEFQDPKMEVLYYIKPYFGGISSYIGLT